MRNAIGIIRERIQGVEVSRIQVKENLISLKPLNPGILEPYK
jgi:hypothetical protein